MLKALKHLSRPVLQYVLGTLAGTVGYVVFFRAAFGPSDSAGGFVTGVILGISIMLCFACMVTYYSNYSAMAISMGASRKSYFIAIQVVKIISSVGFFITMVINSLLMPVLYGTESPYSINTLILLAAVCIFCSVMGESIGVICTRFGKVGMYVYIGICAVFGGVMGMFAVVGSENLDKLANYISTAPAYIILGAVIAASVILSFINWLLYKKSDVKEV